MTAISPSSEQLIFYSNYNFSFVTSLPEVTQRFGHFTQWIGSVDNGNELIGFDKLLQVCQAFVGSFGHQTKLLALASQWRKKGLGTRVGIPEAWNRLP